MKAAQIAKVSKQWSLRQEVNAKPDDFTFLAVIGRGAFGKVVQVRKKDSDQIQRLSEKKKLQNVKTAQAILPWRPSKSCTLCWIIIRRATSLNLSGRNDDFQSVESSHFSCFEGLSDGDNDGELVGDDDGVIVGDFDGLIVGIDVGEMLGCRSKK